MEIQIDSKYIRFVCELNNQRKVWKFISQNQLCLKFSEEVDDLKMGKIVQHQMQGYLCGDLLAIPFVWDKLGLYWHL